MTIMVFNYQIETIKGSQFNKAIKSTSNKQWLIIDFKKGCMIQCDQKEAQRDGISLTSVFSMKRIAN